MIFPSTPILDNFNRANENPLSDGGRWDAGGLQVVSNQATSNGPGGDGCTWRLVYGPDMEVYVTITTLLNLHGDIFSMCNRLDGNGNGYQIAWTKSLTQDTINIQSIAGFTPTNIASFNQNVSVGDKIGMRSQRNIISAWYAPVGTGIWTMLGSAVDNTYNNEGNINAFINEAVSSSCTFDNFGGGSTIIMRKTLTPNGTRTGSRQTVKTWL